ncbi:MAG: HAD hydrolase-like protein [Candidatus Eisenbacteria bacterium]
MHLFFDLDGTLTDPAVGISRCIEHAMFEMARALPVGTDLRRFIGPPLQDTFRTLLGTDEPKPIAEAVKHYRDRFARIGMYENELYPAIPGELGTLSERGYTLWVVTSKPHVFARRIVAHFGVEDFFEGIHGSELDGTNTDKRDLVAHVLEFESIRATDAWMIGDRGHDVRGGVANGVRTAGVLWGYGSRDELEEAGADIILEQPGQLSERFSGEGA